MTYIVYNIVFTLYNSLYDSICITCSRFSAQIFSQLSQVYSHANFLFEYMNFLKNHPQRVLHFVNLSNLGNALQRNLKTHSAWECIFRASGGTNFKNLPTWCQLW